MLKHGFSTLFLCFLMLLPAGQVSGAEQDEGRVTVRDADESKAYRKTYNGIRYFCATNEDYSRTPNVKILRYDRRIEVDEMIIFPAIAEIDGVEYKVNLIIAHHYPYLGDLFERSISRSGRHPVRVFYRRSYGNAIVYGVQDY